MPLPTTGDPELDKIIISVLVGGFVIGWGYNLYSAIRLRYNQTVYGEDEKPKQPNYN